MCRNAKIWISINQICLHVSRCCRWIYFLYKIHEFIVDQDLRAIPKTAIATNNNKSEFTFDLVKSANEKQ